MTTLLGGSPPGIFLSRPNGSHSRTAFRTLEGVEFFGAHGFRLAQPAFLAMKNVSRKRLRQRSRRADAAFVVANDFDDLAHVVGDVE